MLKDEKIKEIEDYVEEYIGELEMSEIINRINEVSDEDVKLEVGLAVIEKYEFLADDLADALARSASTPEKKQELRKIYEEKGLKINPYIFKVDSIEMRIAEKAAQNWGEPLPENLEEAKKITGGSEIAVAKGIDELLGIDEKYSGILYDIYSRTEISSWRAEIQEVLNGENKYNSILDILSTIHNEWVKNHSNNFLAVKANGERRNKERQFVPLELLDWGEVQSDLLFLKPVLEATGVEIKEEQLKEQFDFRQQEYLTNNKIFSHEDLVNHLRGGSRHFYPTLEGLETTNGGSIDALLRNPKILEEMATQIEGRVSIKAEELEQNNQSSVDQRDIVKADKVNALTKSEIGGMENLFRRIKEKIKGIFSGKNGRGDK